MENTKYGKGTEGRWTPIRAKAQDTKANPNSWETHLVRKRWDIGLIRALSLRIMVMMMNIHASIGYSVRKDSSIWIIQLYLLVDFRLQRNSSFVEFRISLALTQVVDDFLFEVTFRVDIFVHSVKSNL